MGQKMENVSNSGMFRDKISRFPLQYQNLSSHIFLAYNIHRPKSPTKVETKRKLQQFTASGWLIMNGGQSENEKKKTFRLKLHSI